MIADVDDAREGFVKACQHGKRRARPAGDQFSLLWQQVMVDVHRVLMPVFDDRKIACSDRAAAGSRSFQTHLSACFFVAFAAIFGRGPAGDTADTLNICADKYFFLHF